MGLQFIDQFSLLHLAVGIVFYFWGINIYTSIVIHTVFEIFENTDLGMKIINNFTSWPGGKNYRDSFINSVGDTVFFILGWYIAKTVDKYQRKAG